MEDKIFPSEVTQFGQTQSVEISKSDFSGMMSQPESTQNSQIKMYPLVQKFDMNAYHAPERRKRDFLLDQKYKEYLRKKGGKKQGQETKQLLTDK